MTIRDRWLLAMLPAFLAFVVGWIVLVRPASREARMVQLRVENQGSLDARRAQVASAELDRREMAEAVEQKKAELARTGAVFDRNSAVQRISLLCATHGLSLLKSEPSTAASLSAALRASGASIGGTMPVVWKIEFTGEYPSVVKLLADLEKSQPLVIPLQISMETRKTERQPGVWALTLWL